DAEEDAGPNGGDGNDDNQQDSDQANVATFHTQDGTNYVTLESAAGTTLADCSAVSVPTASGAPSGVTFPYGFIEFTINGAGAGGATTLIIYLPAGANINTYWKYGPTPTNSKSHWYEFMYDSATLTGAKINGNKITLQFIDGQRGDDDITANGIIIDQGGPGTYSSSGGSPPDHGSGGGCFIRAAYGK
ncbi:MAG: choice-of-anchor U domain-containing protein, partial [Candidatus Cloacimonadota bacterium]|nr:choice-of-anchor U domain-containing protein [Candidatus Cloacimonadota bacterium]